MSEYARNTLKYFFPQKALKYQEYKEIQSPQHIVPAGSVPEAGQKPDDKHVAHCGQVSSAAPAKRNIHIIPEKRAQGNMPATPEILDR